MELSLTPAQKQIVVDRHRFRVLCCGRRFGKTTLAIDTIKARASLPDSRVCYIAPTYQQARDIAWNELKKDCLNVSKSINESRLEIKLVNNSFIILRGWEAIETLRGQYFDLIVIDEIASMRNFDIQWEEVIRPTLTDTKGEVMFISTPKGFNHFYDVFLRENEDNDYKSFHFTTYDNPHIPSDEIDKAKKEMSEDRFAQEYMADFRKMEGLVYKDFNRVFHVVKEFPVFETVDRLVPVDWGWTNPAAAYLIQKDRDLNYWISREFYKTQQTTSQIIEWVKSYNGNKYYPDPAEPDRNEEMRRAGLNVRDVSKDIEAGINTVTELLKNKRIKIHASCTHLISEFETYRYPEKKVDHNEPEVPVDEDNHALDAIRYALHMQSSSESHHARQFIPRGMSARRGYTLPT